MTTPPGDRTATTILIVDDDPGFGRAATELLTARGYRVVGHAGTAREAVEQCRRLCPDGVLLDVRLPDGDGVALAGTLRAAAAGLRILLTSSDPNAVAPDRLRRSAASGFVPKLALTQADLGAIFGG
jgi:DNA-binding NarL/FixJ family response regulator